MPYSGTGKKGEMVIASEVRETAATEYDVPLGGPQKWIRRNS